MKIRTSKGSRYRDFAPEKTRAHLKWKNDNAKKAIYAFDFECVAHGGSSRVVEKKREEEKEPARSGAACGRYAHSVFLLIVIW